MIVENVSGRPGKRIHVVQGEHHISSDPDVILTTILGSCVAVCMRDPKTGVGGMNHFLLPSGKAEGLDEGRRYGAYAMELLINELLRSGARRDRLEAKLFGGARMFGGLSDVGASNAAFARQFLKTENIPCVAESLGGQQARRITFHPATGRARQLLIPNEQVDEARPPPKPAPKTSVELF